ncbi:MULTISPECIES: ABC transporter ATP-binding protein [Bifidobacterium]|jgi:ABC-2 type transport system ATP-binding protein|uniref:ABC transporter ATP-binding protein n=1 Tax=Bifidobacterium tibiigranuli TaxID=2172043 RepID=A0A5N6S500_9BIFI|nr:ABC transporter ATP-binding protein [Bifidobacterium tibiigranuli]KAE8128451.1 ABC transporter ATP-binding protein [Bifidobacterium tibiigranuli]KAE8128533.1 ABC transporter [Bifidobacterium tibiigranuli]MCH3974992.1 ABC transporter ATP-binding protein [Bifidobacterium tibiigranuli]MCH4189213.1 ABC transporter ATP-binding protein [Bifidobacterium tibiigranuli]MCH4202752.1 ABC transporter ATP-binding protein [Bifidobacterium tibiigranuli]
MGSVIAIEQLRKSFGSVHALDGVSFNVGEGEVVGFIGPNGAGKSTTIRTLLGILRRDGGSATIFGKDVWSHSQEIHRRLSYVPGDVSLWGNLSGGEIIDLFMKLHGGGSAARRNELTERFELDPRKKAKGYSKGNRQKVGLIAALSVDSDLYILDEPTSGLDPLMESVFQEEIASIKAQGKSVLLSSHILSEVERLADRVVIISKGVIVDSGTLDQLRHLTRSTVTISAVGDLGTLEHLEGVHDFVRKGVSATFSLDNAATNDVLRHATKLGITKFEAVPPTLEDLFMRHYAA